MFKPVRTQFVSLMIAAALLLAGCSKDDDDAPSSLAALGGEDPLLAYVPADSPYVIASIEPLPDDVMDKLEPKMDRVLQAYQKLLSAAMQLAAAEAEEEGEDPADFAKLQAVAGELGSLMSVEGLRNAGIGRDATGIVYGNGLLPVIRLQVSDGKLFDAAIARVEASAGEKMSVASIDGKAYRYIEADDVKVLLGIFGDHVVLSFAPSIFDEDELRELLGLTLPDRNIAAAGTLAKIADEYGYTGNYVGYIDVVGVVERFVGSRSGLDVTLLELIDKDQPPLSDVCREEIREMAQVAPRAVMGYTAINEDRAESQLVLELREDIAEGLAKVTAPVPGLSGDMGGLVSFGMSLNIKAMREFYEARLDALEDDPYECDAFAEMQAGVQAGRQALNQPVMPMVYDFRGFVGVINDIEGLDLKNKTPPTSVDGRFMLAIDNAPAVLSLGAMMSPELMQLDLEPDGEPVRFQSAAIQAMFEYVYLAMNDDALAMSVGEGVEGELSGMLSADTEDNGTFFNFSMDAQRYFAFIGEAMQLAEQDDADPMPPEFQAAMNEVMLAASELYTRMSADMRFTERGVEMNSVVTLGD